MINIILNNSQSRIVGLEKKILFQLRTTVCYFNMSSYIRTKNIYAARVFLIDENGFFPTGLLKRVEKFLNCAYLLFQVVDNRIIPKQNYLSLKDLIEEPPIYPEQEEASSIIFKNISGIVQMPTGIGKTRVIKEALLKIQRPSLIITPSSNLKYQTFDYLLESFGERYVGLMDSNKPKPITVTNWHAISKQDPSFFNLFDTMFFDEFHNSAALGFRDSNISHLNNIYYKYGLTATNFKNDENASILLESILADELYSISIQDAINKKYIVALAPIFLNVFNKGKIASGDYRTDYKDYIDNNSERNSLCLDYCPKLVKNNIPTLILVEHVEHGRYLQSNLPGFIFLNGQDESAKYNLNMVDKFNKGEIPGLIGTSVIGEGVNTKAAGAVFNMCGGKAKSEILQRAGRVVRNFPGKNVGYYFDFIDHGQKHLFKQSKERRLIIEESFGVKAKIL